MTTRTSSIDLLKTVTIFEGRCNVMKSFKEPTFEIVLFDSSIIATSGCGCYDPDWCPVDNKNCTSDGSDCECQINHVAGTANCT